jgi:hypothetical protein
MTLEELGDKFIVKESLEKKDVERHIERLLAFCQIDSQGHVRIKDHVEKNLTIQQKILCILSARFLGNQLQSLLGKDVTIRPEANADELVKMTGEKKAVIQARAKELKDHGQIKADTGQYSIEPHAIGDLIQILETRGIKNG